MSVPPKENFLDETLTWMLYRGFIAAVVQKWSLEILPSGSYGVEFTTFAIAVNFSKNGTTTKAHIPGMKKIPRIISVTNDYRNMKMSNIKVQYAPFLQIPSHICFAA